MAGLSAINCPTPPWPRPASETCTATYTTHPDRRRRRVDQQHGHGHGHPAGDRPARSRHPGHHPGHPVARPQRDQVGSTTTSYSALGQVIPTLSGHQHRQRDPDHGRGDRPPYGLSLGHLFAAATLAPGASETCTATYTMTQADARRRLHHQHGHGHGHAAQRAVTAASSTAHHPANQSPAIGSSSRPASAATRPRVPHHLQLRGHQHRQRDPQPVGRVPDRPA